MYFRDKYQNKLNMKRLLLFSVFCTLVMGLSAQKIVTRVNAPVALAGSKVFVAAAFGADITASVLTADAACGTPSIACTALTNPADIAGKIALIDRGTCSFDQKCLNAQNAGAVGVIVFNNIAGAVPFGMGVATQAIADQITIPCVMMTFEDGVALKAACAAGETINITIGSLPKQPNDLAIYTNVLPNYAETYVFNPQWGAVPNREINTAGDFFFQPGAFFRNEGTETINNINVSFELKKGANVLSTQTTTDNVSLEVDSVAGLIVEGFDFSTLTNDDSRLGRYDVKYEVKNDQPDPLDGDNKYSTYMNITSNIYSKCRFNTATKTPLAAQFWGGGTDYRELLSPINLRAAKGATIDSLFTMIASNEPLASVFIEGRIYKFNDINGDGDVTSDELELVAIGAYSFPGDFAGTQGVVRFGLDDLVGDPNDPYMVEDDNTLYFASVSYPGGSNTFFNGYDIEFTQRSYFNLKESIMELDITDYPYLSVRTQDATTGGPDMSTAGLFYVDANGDGAAQDQEIAFFAPTLAIEINYPIVNTKDISGDLEVKLELSPVPAKDVLVASFSLDEASKVNYQIIAANGNVVFNQYDKVAAKDFTTTFNLNGLAAGTYYLKINTDKGFTKKAFVKVN